MQGTEEVGAGGGAMLLPSEQGIGRHRAEKLGEHSYGMVNEDNCNRRLYRSELGGDCDPLPVPVLVPVMLDLDLRRIDGHRLIEGGDDK